MLLWIHGGGYIIGSPEMNEILCRRIVAETGAVVASVDYRLAPEANGHDLVHDCYAALTWMYANADEMGGDAARIAISGASAGGGLAATTTIFARDRGEVPVIAQLLIYPMLDDRTSSTVAAHEFAGEYVWTPDSNIFGWTAIQGGAEPGGAEVSAYISAARVESMAGLPPTFISVGTLDLFVEEDIAYATRLIQAGVPTELHVYPGAFHAFDMAEGSRVADAFYRDFLGAMRRHFHG
jgi:triacylglycerol lipase